MESFRSIADVGAWVLFGAAVVLDVYSSYVSVLRALGRPGPSPVVFVPVVVYWIRIVTLKPSMLWLVALSGGALAAHAALVFGVPLLVRRVVRSPSKNDRSGNEPS